MLKGRDDEAAGRVWFGGGGGWHVKHPGVPLVLIFIYVYIIREVIFINSKNSSETVIFQNYAFSIFLSSIKGTCSP